MTDNSHLPLTRAADGSDKIEIDLAAEALTVSKRVVDKALVTISKRVVVEDASVTLQELSHLVEVERRPINTISETPPPPTRELADGTIIYNVIREIPVVVTHYELVEEVHVRQVNMASDQPHVIPVRRETLDVTRETIPSTESAAASSEGVLGTAGHSSHNSVTS